MTITSSVRTAPANRHHQNALEQKARLEAELAEQDGRTTVSALFDTDGNLVAAKLVNTRHGVSWAILASDDPTSEAVDWFNPSRARDLTTRNANNAKNGYYIGRVAAPAKVILDGEGPGLYAAVVRADGGFSRDVTVLNARP